MAQEYEVQITDINPDEIQKKLRDLGAIEEEECFQKRWIFDIRCLNSEDPRKGEWIRLREKSGKVTLTYKNKKGKGISDTEEIEVGVDDFDKMKEILSKSDAFEGKYYQENKTKIFKLDDIEFSIDTWPMIPPILEIEGESEASVKKGLKLLGFEGDDYGHPGLIDIYKKYGIDLHSIEELTFK
jgi:adenylate cyclase class 2